MLLLSKLKLTSILLKSRRCFYWTVNWYFHNTQPQWSFIRSGCGIPSTWIFLFCVPERGLLLNGFANHPCDHLSYFKQINIQNIISHISFLLLDSGQGLRFCLVTYRSEGLVLSLPHKKVTYLSLWRARALTASNPRYQNFAKIIFYKFWSKISVCQNFLFRPKLCQNFGSYLPKILYNQIEVCHNFIFW